HQFSISVMLLHFTLSLHDAIPIYKDMRLDDLLEKMESIAASGTRLNLDYAIDEMLDEYEQEDILDYFRSCETSSLQVAQDELSRSEEHTSELQSRENLVCRLLLEK